jgi:hypothetical protein
MTDNDTYERKDFNDFVIGDTTPDNSPENLAFLADVSPEMANFDFSEVMFD